MEYSWKQLCTKLMKTPLSFVEIRITAQNGTTGPSNGVPELLSHVDFLSDSFVLNAWQITEAFHCFYPPLFGILRKS